MGKRSGASYEERQGRASGGGNPKHASGPSNGFVSFWPTEAERAILAADQRGSGELIDDLQIEAERGLEFKIGMARDKSSMFLTCREQGTEYGTGTTIAVFHSSLPRAILAMLYCLRTKWPDFPEKPPVVTQKQIDW
jgi:hypothetical protein